MFTCLCSCAVHIETTNSLTTDSFIQALKRLISRRRIIRTIWSNNGSNFVGAGAELKMVFNEMGKKKTKNFLMELEWEWLIWKHNLQVIWESVGMTYKICKKHPCCFACSVTDIYLEISSFSKSVPKTIIICYTVLETWYVFHFGLIFALLHPPLTAWKMKT